MFTERKLKTTRPWISRKSLNVHLHSSWRDLTRRLRHNNIRRRRRMKRVRRHRDWLDITCDRVIETCSEHKAAYVMYVCLLYADSYSSNYANFKRESVLSLLSLQSKQQWNSPKTPITSKNGIRLWFGTRHSWERRKGEGRGEEGANPRLHITAYNYKFTNLYRAKGT